MIEKKQNSGGAQKPDSQKNSGAHQKKNGNAEGQARQNFQAGQNSRAEQNPLVGQKSKIEKNSKMEQNPHASPTPPAAQKRQEAPLLREKKMRYWELDFIRGLCVVLMIFYHFFYSAAFILGEVHAWIGAEFWLGLKTFAQLFLVNKIINVALYTVISVFLFLCGISCSLTRNNTLRGLKTLALALVITVVTWLADSMFVPGTLILFGIIHALGTSMLLFSLVDLLGAGIMRLFKKGRGRTVALWVRRMLPAALGIVGIIVFFGGGLMRFGQASQSVIVDGNPVVFYFNHLFTNIQPTDSRGLNNFLSMFVYLKGFPFPSSDHFAVFPYAFVLLIGGTVGQLVYRTRAKTALVRLDGAWNKPVCFVGRHAMLVYLAHQVIIVAFLFAAGGVYSLFH